MAVSRAELMPSEAAWVVAVLEAAGQPPHEMRNALREMRRARDAGLEQEAREKRQAAKMRAAYPTDAANACGSCRTAAPQHAPDCPVLAND